MRQRELAAGFVARLARALVTRAVLALALLALALLALFVQPASASATEAVITFEDSDGIVGPGAELDVHVWVRDPQAIEYTLQFLHAVGGAFVLDSQNGRGRQFSSRINQDGERVPTVTIRVVVPLGARHGESTISALVATADGETLPLVSRTLVIGDPGEPIGTAVIEPSSKRHEQDGQPISTSLRRGELAYLRLTVLNSLGNPTNDADVKSIILVAPQARLGRGSARPHADAEHLLHFDDDSDDSSVSADATTLFSLVPISNDAAHITLYAMVIGADHSVGSNQLELNFAGAPARLEAEKLSASLAAVNGEIRVIVSGLDSVGGYTTVKSANVRASVVEGPGGAQLSRVRASDRQCRRSDVDCETDQVVVLLRTFSSEASHGHYQVEIELSDAATPSSTRVEFIVVGEPVFLSLELYGSNDPIGRLLVDSGSHGLLFFVPGQGEADALVVSPGELVFAAAVLRDEFGELIAQSSPAVRGDGVTFQSPGLLELVQLDKGEQEIERGVATARLLVVGASGSATLIASTDQLDDSVQVLTADLASEAGRLGPGRLSHMRANSFVAWTGGTTGRASQVLDGLRRRGIVAIRLWRAEEMRWIIYTDISDDRPDAGPDFEIMPGDVLWLQGSTPGR